MADLLEQIEQETLERRRPNPPRILGRKQILKADPLHRPKDLNRSPAPAFHTATAKVFKELCDAYKWFVVAYRAAADALKEGRLDVAFPEGCFPPALPFVPG